MPFWVAKKDIAPATPVRPGAVQSAPWSRESLPKGAFNNLAELEGRVVAFPLVEGELILEKKLAPKGPSRTYRPVARHQTGHDR